MSLYPEIYVYGDIDTAEKVIQGMNMIFNSSGWYSASGAQFNAGGFFTFAVMLTLWGSILAWFIHQRLNLGPVLLAFLIYIVMTVPRTPLMIEDVFSGDTRVVADTPLGIAVVASLGSTIAKKMADQFDTVFTPIGSTSTMYNNGFASNLQLMLSLRKIITTPKNPYFFTNFARYMATCAKLSTSTTSYDAATGKVAYLLSNYDNTAGPITYQTITYPDGRGVSCATAASDLSTELTNYMQGLDGQASVDLNAAIAAPTGTAYSSMAQPRYVFQNDVVQAVQEGTGMSQLQARNFMTDLLFNQWAIGSMGCGSAADETAFQECVTSITEASETAKIDSAMQASIFQKIMIPLMNLLTYLFYGLAPIVIVVAVATGIAGISIILKYALFGFWIQSWMPAAILINYITMEQTKTAFKNFYWSWQHGAFNPIHFYDIVSTKLMVSSEILAATPMITLAILGGGAYAMTNIAGAAGKSASSKTDASSASPKLRKVEPLFGYSGNKVSNAGRHVGRQYSRGASVPDPTAGAQSWLGTGQMRKALSTQLSAAKARVSTLTNKRVGAVQAIGSAVSKQGVGASYTTTGGGTQTVTGQDMRSVQSAILDRVGGSSRLSDQKKADLTSYFQGYAALAADTPKGKRGKKERQQLKDQMSHDLSSGRLGVQLSAKEAAEAAHDWIKAASKEGSVDLQHVRSGSLAFSEAAQLTRAAATSENVSFDNEARDVESYSNQLEEAEMEQKRLEETASTMEAFERAIGGSYADIIYQNWQQGLPVVTKWNPDRFRGLTHAGVKQGFITADQANEMNHTFHQQYDQNLDFIRRQDPRLTSSQAESLAGFKTWVDFNSGGASVRFDNLLNQEKGAVLKDYIGPGQGPGKEFLKTHGDRMAEGERIQGPVKSGKLAQLLDNQGKGPTSLYSSIKNGANDGMERLSSPEAAFDAATTEAKERYAEGANNAKEQYKNNGHHRKYNARKRAFNAQWENSYYAAAVEKAASMSDEFQEQITQFKTTGASVGYAWDQLGSKFNKRLAAHQSEVIAGLEKRLEEVNAQIPKASSEPTLFGFGDSEKTDLIQEKAALEQDIAEAKAFRTELLNTSGDRPSPKEVLQQSYRHEANLMGLSELGTKTYMATRMAAYENGNLPWTDQEKTLQELRPRMKDFSGPNANAQHNEAMRGWLMAYKIAIERNGTAGFSPWQDYDNIYDVMSRGPEPMGAKSDFPKENKSSELTNTMGHRPQGTTWFLNPLSKSTDTPNR